MILHLYDRQHNYIGIISNATNIKIISKLDGGTKTLSFSLTTDDLTVVPEGYIRTTEDEFTIKEVSLTSGSYKEIVCELNLEDLDAKVYKAFNITDTTLSDAATLVLAGTGWTVGTCDVTKSRSCGISQKTGLGVIQDLVTVFMCEISFDTLNKKVNFYSERGSDKGTYFIAGLNLKKLTSKCDTYDFATRIIPYGSNNLTIESVNDGKNYLDNNQYSNKVITYIWTDTNYTSASALKEDAAAKLEDLSKPIVSYSASIIDLANMSDNYEILSFEIGDTVRLFDETTGVAEKQRIKQIVNYPDNPEKNTCQLSNTALTFEEIQKKVQESNELVNSTVNNDGTISISRILNWENEIETSEGIKGYIESEVGTLTANKATIDFANIDTANINTAKMGSLLAKIGLIDSATIEEGHVTGYLDSVAINADKIKAGTLIIDRLVVKDSEGHYRMLSVDESGTQTYTTLNGDVVTDNSITVDKLIVDTALANKIFAEDITATGTITGDSLTINGTGSIAGWTLGTSSLYNNLSSISGTDKGIYLGTDGFRFYDSDDAYTDIVSGGITTNSLLATGGTIGGWTIGTSSLYNNLSSISETDNSGIYLGTDGIRSLYKTDSDYAYTDIIDGSITVKSSTGEYLFLNTGNFQLVNGSILSFHKETDDSYLQCGSLYADFDSNTLIIENSGATNSELQLVAGTSETATLSNTKFDVSVPIYESGTSLSQKYAAISHSHKSSDLPSASGTVKGIVSYNDSSTTFESTSTSSGTAKQISSTTITLKAGFTYIAVCHGTFASNATGRRTIYFIPSSTTTANAEQSQYASVSAVDGAATKFDLVQIITPAKDTAYRVCAFQNSGSALNVSAIVQLFRMSS